MKRRTVRFLLAAALLGIGLVVWGYLVAISEPQVRRAVVPLPGWPAGAPPLSVLLISDIHVAGPDMPPERLRGIVRRINALKPDLVLIAGDLVSDKGLATRHYSSAESVAPLAGLRPRLGTIAVLGNHDHWREAPVIEAALKQAGVTLLKNEAVRRGPIVIAGADDIFTDHADLTALQRSAARFAGPAVALSHSPDVAPKLGPRFGLVLAGHTHCGQIQLPLIGPVSTQSNYGKRYSCGLIRERGRTVIVTAGLGTSVLPLRFGAVPDLWLVRIGPR